MWALTASLPILLLLSTLVAVVSLDRCAGREKQVYAVSGTVVGRHGEPLPLVTVALRVQNPLFESLTLWEACTVTDRHGAFCFPWPLDLSPRGPYSLEFSKTGYRVRRFVRLQGPREFRPIRLEPQP